LPSSSVIIEFYLKTVRPIVTDYDRADYFVKLYYNDDVLTPK